MNVYVFLSDCVAIVSSVSSVKDFRYTLDFRLFLRSLNQRYSDHTKQNDALLAHSSRNMSLILSQ